MRWPIVPFVFLASTVWVAAAQAQTTPARRHPFVAAHFGPKWDDVRSLTGRSLGHVLERGVSFGIESEAAGIEVDVSVPGWHESQTGPSRYQPPGRYYVFTTTHRRRSPEVSVLLRRNRRLSDNLVVTWLVGGAAAFRRMESVRIEKEVLPDGSVVEVSRDDERSTRDYFGAVAGLEASVKLARHWAIVPRVRLTVFNNILNIWDGSPLAPRGFVIRPQVAVRCTF